jgi:YVTN family beta-propeller protein
MAAKLIATALALALLGACGSNSPDTQTTAAGSHIASARTSKPVVDAAASKLLLSTRASALSPTGDLAYEQGRRTVTTMDLETSKPTRHTPVPDGMQLDVASTSGRFLAFAEPREPGANPWIPAGRARTKFTIAPTESRGRGRTYDIKGNFDIEAFSTDDRQLFLIEFMPARHPWHYGLRRLVLESGRLREIARTKQNAPGEMNGTGRMSLFSPAGNELYTLYTQQGPNYTHTAPEDAHAGNVYAFVHLLNLDGAWTHCIDLPAPFGTGDVTTHAMAVSGDGSRLYVADPSSGGVAVIDPGTQRVLNSVTRNLRSLRQGVSAAVSSDGTLYLAGTKRILAFDGDSLRLLRTLPLRRPVSAIATGTDASKLYVAVKNGVDTLDATTGRRLERI